MIVRRVASALTLTTAVFALAGCLEADVQTKLSADGSGTMSVRMGLTDGMVDVMTRMKEIDPDDGTLAELKQIEFEKPTEAELAEMKVAGVDLLEFEGEASEKRVFSKFKVAFKTVSGLERLDALEAEGGDSPMNGVTLTKEDDGTYTLMLRGDDDDEDGEEEEVEFDFDDEEEDEATGDEDPEEAMRQAAAAIELMGKMMAEMANLKMVFGMEVPGEIISFEPKTLGVVDGGKVTWTFDMASIMAASAAGEDASPDGDFSVRFRMPEGQSIPESALWSGAAPAEETPSGESGR